MKIIFSRKGFDGGSGGVPSPIVDGIPISLPIPSELEHTRFRDLKDPVPEMIADLTERLRVRGGGKPQKVARLTANDFCHLDPDIDPTALRTGRPEGWRGALGQIGKSQAHLARAGIGEGDLFLFWGLFQSVEKSSGSWRYVGRPVHLIFGWLQIAEVQPGGRRGMRVVERHPWMSGHAHTRPGWERWPKHENSNTIYIAEERLSILPGVDEPGSGVLKKGVVLSAPDERLKSVWKVPDWLHPASGGTGMSYHPSRDRWLDGNKVQTVGRGQEFVADIGDAAAPRDWLREAIFRF